MGKHLKSIRSGRLAVHGDNDTLASHRLCRLANQRRPPHRRGIDCNLIGTGPQQRADIVHRAHATADGQRHETRLGRGRDHLVKGFTVVT